MAVTAALRATPAPRRRFLPRRRPPRASRTAGCEPTWHFNGKIDRPIAGAPRADAGRAAAAATTRSTATSPGDAVALWDLAADIATDRVTDRSPNRLHGRTVNAPKRAVTGHNWDGRRWTGARRRSSTARSTSTTTISTTPAGEPSLTLTVPADLPQRRVRASPRGGRGPTSGSCSTSGRRAAGHAPGSPSSPRPRPTSPTPTTAADGAGAGRAGLRRACTRSTRPTSSCDHPELGASTYDPHCDGSGVCHASSRRPIFNMRPTGTGSGTCASTSACSTGWRRTGALRRRSPTTTCTRGRAAPRAYRVVLTGCHPEYYSTEMLDALDAYLGQRRPPDVHGRQRLLLAGLVPAEQPGMIEMRRAEDGTRRGWNRPASTITLDRRVRRALAAQGRAPNALVGVGFVAQGFDRSSYYRRTAGRRDPRARSSSRASRTRSSATSAWPGRRRRARARRL